MSSTKSPSPELSEAQWRKFDRVDATLDELAAAGDPENPAEYRAYLLDLLGGWDGCDCPECSGPEDAGQSWFPVCGCRRGTEDNGWRSAACVVTHFDDGPVRGQHRRFFPRIPCQSLGALGVVPAGHPDAAAAACECGVNVGELHHVLCDMETCPVCHGQALGCRPGDHCGSTP
jgi:hypothetical protein